MPSYGSSTEFQDGKERHFCLWKGEKWRSKRSPTSPKGGLSRFCWGWKNNFPQGTSRVTQLIDRKLRRRALSRHRLGPGPSTPQSLASRDHVWSSQCPVWGWHPGGPYPSFSGTSRWTHMVTHASSYSAHLFIGFIILELLVFHRGKTCLAVIWLISFTHEGSSSLSRSLGRPGRLQTEKDLWAPSLSRGPTTQP